MLEAKPIKAYSEDEITKMLIEFQSCLYLAKNSSFNIENQEIFDQFSAGLVVMFTYLTGVKTDKIEFIRVRDVLIDENIIILNKIKCPMSLEFMDALKFYFSLRYDIEKNDPLFINLYTKKIEGDTRDYQKFLTRFSKTDITGIIRYRINNYVRNNIPRVIIKQVTGIKDGFMDGSITSEYEENFDFVYILFKEQVNNHHHLIS